MLNSILFTRNIGHRLGSLIMNKIFLSILIFFLVVTTSCAASKTPVKIVKILDGDTTRAKINDNIFSIRLIGIDCYETTPNNRAYRQAYNNNLTIDEVIKNGKFSKKYLINLYKKSNVQTFEFMGLDYYKRPLGVLYFDDVNINQKMLNHGGCLKF